MPNQNKTGQQSQTYVYSGSNNFLDGTYTFKASSTSTGGSPKVSAFMFDNDQDTIWAADFYTGNASYAGTSPYIYVGGTELVQTNYNGGTVYGEYFDVTLPFQMELKTTRMMSNDPNADIRFFKTFTVLGSNNDGTTFELIGNYSHSANTQDTFISTTINSNVKYSMFRVVVTSLFGPFASEVRVPQATYCNYIGDCYEI